VQCFGGLGETALMHDFDKTAQLFEFHRLIPFWNGFESNNSLRRWQGAS
jgi:hypothetical protein